MNGPIAQVAALVCHANAFLGGREIPRFFPGNSTCQYCEQIEFVELDSDAGGAGTRRLVAAGPDDWIRELPLREVDGLRLSWRPRNDPNISDRLAAGFVGGGRIWHMHVLRDDGMTEVWSSDWGVGAREAANRRIWFVDYRLEATRPGEHYAGRNLAVVRQAFADRLGDILNFAERHTEASFAAQFREALRALDDPAAEIGYHRDLALPGQLAPVARALLQASMRAWVFGGMGSWNDMGFAEPLRTEYENVSEGLFEIIHEAIETAVASTYLAS
jgi:hypothetical protein